jgi:hypothetical protein
MIRFSKYVRIVSGVGGASAVRQRDLIGRLITQGERMSPGEVLEFADAASVAAHFGNNSPEHLRALFYFGYVSPSISSPRSLSFSRYAPAGTAPKLFGGKLSASLATLKTITAGVLGFKFNGGDTVDVTALNFAAAATFADIATTLQTAIRATADANLDAATVTYDAPSNSFKLVCAGAAGLSDVTFAVVQAGAGLTDAAAYLKWYDADAIVTHGAAAQTPVQAFEQSVAISNNFGSFVIMPSNVDGAFPALEDLAAVAAANAAMNVAFHFSVPVKEADAETWSAALIGFAGTSLTLSPIATEYPELAPVAQLAAIDYTRRNASTNYMFRQFGGLTPSVQADALSDSLDALRVNYYGRTQTAGATLDFYQRGVMMGGVTAPVDMSVYGNEAWFKDACASAIMDLLLSASRVPANESGRGMILAVVQDVIDLALVNGVVSVGKSLTSAQKLFVSQQTGDDLAWHQVEANGYIVSAEIVEYTNTSGVQEYKCVYSVLYSKDDAVRLVEGSHSLI